MSFPSPTRLCATALMLLASTAGAQAARISETTRTIPTYAFSEPDRVPMLARDERLYPYHAFDGYAAVAAPHAWRVVTLENDLIAVDVLPEVGGKVWGATVKQTGRDFIYRNHVLKFRNVALRGPWTSGGVEFNFGVVGHTPSTATPVDYRLLHNADGSVSCVVGMMDLPSRTQWRVEIRLQPGRAAFETNVLWYNPTPLEQPYYNWMTAAAPARPDLVMTIPGNSFLGHPGDVHPWPIDSAGRMLDEYSANAFGGNKSYHVVGERADFFGGYYRAAGVGFGHWAPYDQMPGQKLWLWALSRAGGIWEDLLTDTDGQYVEYQAGRLLVQYTPSGAVNPVAQAGFDPGATDRWSESWFPLEQLGGLTAASRDGAIHADTADGRLLVTAEAFEARTDTLEVSGTDGIVHRETLVFAPLVPITRTLPWPAGQRFRVRLPGLAIDHDSDPGGRELSRPWVTDSAAVATTPETGRWDTEAAQLALGRHYPAARARYQQVLDREPWDHDALLGMAQLEYRRGRYRTGLDLARRALQLDGYDAQANFLAGIFHQALGDRADALDAFGWAARSLGLRAASQLRMAEVELTADKPAAARRHALAALDNSRHDLPARELLAMIAHRMGDSVEAARLDAEMLAIDPLHHFVAAERYLAAPTGTARQSFRAGLQGEYPDQVILELAIDLARRGATSDAITLLGAGEGPIVEAWRAYLSDDPKLVGGAAPLDFVFPYRPETIPVLRWVVDHNTDWSWRYLLALNLWACDRAGEGADLLQPLDGIDFGPALVARGLLLASARGRDPVPDIRRGVAIAPRDRELRVILARTLLDQGDWTGALAAADSGRRRFPGDFNLDLLAVKALVQLGRADAALAILDHTRVLPSENARDSHQLYVQAQTIAALDAITTGRISRARTHLVAALEWPEHLGQGKPYDPEERLTRYLLGEVAFRAGDRTGARAAWEAAARAPASSAPALALVTAMARARLGEIPFPTAPTTGLDDLDGRLVLRAMDLPR